MLTKELFGYTFYEDGRVVNKDGKLMQKIEKNGKYELRLTTDKGRQTLIFARLYYYLFVEKFDIDNKDLCVSPKDGNHLNITKDNLTLIPRKDLIQGDKHKKRAKLTDEEINQIRSLYTGCVGVNQHNKTGLSYNDLAIRFGVTKGEIALILQGRARNKENYKLK